MTYNTFLDLFFSSVWLNLGIAAVLITILIIYRKPLYVDRKRKKLIVFFLFLIGMLWLMTLGLINPKYLGYGRPVAVTSITMMNGNLLVIDFIRTAGGKTSKGESCYRIHNIDPV